MLADMPFVGSHEAIGYLAVLAIAPRSVIVYDRQLPTKVLVADPPVRLAAFIRAVAEVMARGAFRGHTKGSAFVAVGA